MRIKHSTPFLLAIALLLGSCTTPRNITYFQDVTQGAVINPAEQLEIRVKPEDKLSIIVTTQDPALSNLFNLVQVQSKLGSGESSIAGGAGTSDGRISYYTVNRSGNINFPVLGELHIVGLSRYEVAEYIEKRLK
ncbi:MAG: polysaccharide biosynthesis/export family protein, partial [Muribaculaceae bacterium]|nr:polysaccharide biosynthesis/export family protein [Muribaculaceae bacterium]